MKPAFSLLSLLVAFASGVYSQGHLHDGAALMERDELLNVTANGVDLDVEDDGNSLDLSTLEKRKGCTGHREQGDVCKGRLLVKINSRHNCLKKHSGRCCAEKKNGDKGIDVTSSKHAGEDCGYCFSGKCRAE